MYYDIVKQLFDKAREAFDNENYELSIEYLEKILFYQGDNYKTYNLIGLNKYNLALTLNLNPKNFTGTLIIFQNIIGGIPPEMSKN